MVNFIKRWKWYLYGVKLNCQYNSNLDASNNNKNEIDSHGAIVLEQFRGFL